MALVYQNPLKVACEIDDKKYETGIEITDEQLDELNISQNEFHGEWNYKLSLNSHVIS